MKTRTFALFFVLISSLFEVSAQDYAFKVLANKGNNEVKSGDTWVPLRTGASLRASDEVKLADNAYIGLVHKSGKPMELKNAGNYKVSVLDSQVGTGSSVLNKYTDFILSSNSAEAKKNRLSATGAVHRGDESGAIEVFLPTNQNADIYNNVAVINWDGSKITGPYVITVRNMFEEDLAKFETPETSIRINLDDERFTNENNIHVEVAAKADAKLASAPHLIKRLSPAHQDKVKTLLNEVTAAFTEPSALNYLILAGFYEQNNLFIDAIAAYEDAVKLAPDVPTYKEAYDEFMIRHKLKK